MTSPDERQFETEEDAFVAALADDSTEVQEPTADEGDEQPPAADPDDAGEGVDTTENAQQPPPEDDILSSLPDDARGYVEQLRNRAAELESANQSTAKELAKTRNDHAAMAGKLRPLQQRLAELERRDQKPQAQPATPAQPDNGEGAVDGLDAYLNSPEWKEYAETFPNEAAIWEKGQRIAMQAAENIARREAQRATREIEGRFGPTIQEITTDRAKAAQTSAINELAAEHPDWQQYNSDDRFQQWFDGVYLPEQLDVVQQAFADDKYASKKLSDPKFVSKLLHEFKASNGIPRSGAATEQGSTPAPRAAQASARLAVAASPSIRPNAPSSRLSIERMNPDQAFLAGLNSDD